ncbi:MAG: stage II sporulation protein M [Planctomycetes bacterium]|nr:stage II sporulation protein M [Planctomycetota bacterium]
MSRERFVDQHKKGWNDLERMLTRLDKRQPVSDPDAFVDHYRHVCQHLALARHRHYGPDLVDRLNQLVLRGHQHLYAHQGVERAKVLDYITGGFARDVRKNGRYMLLSLLLFSLSFIGAGLAAYFDEELARAMVSAEALEEMEKMYDPKGGFQNRGTDFGERAAMFGYYIFNNTGIALRTFASGLVFGIGAIFVIIYNGIMIGCVAGHLTRAGCGEPFWSFVIGHGSFELTAIVLAGGAGLKLGDSIIRPGRRRRVESLIESAQGSAGLVSGFSLMLFAAAFLEAFWSPLSFVPTTLKLVVGTGLWISVIGYFLFAGRGAGSGS